MASTGFRSTNWSVWKKPSVIETLGCRRCGPSEYQYNVHSAGGVLRLCVVVLLSYIVVLAGSWCVSRLFLFFSSYRQLSVGSCTTDSSQVLKCPQLTVIRVRWEVTRAWLVRRGKSHFWSAIGCPECQSDHFCGNPEVFTFKVVESNDFSEVLLV